MRLSRAIVLSVLITLALTLILQLLFGAMAFGLFFFLPLSFFFAHNRNKQEQQGPGRHKDNSGPDSRPIEPS